MEPDLTICVISADNLDLLLPCLKSLFEEQRRVALEVFVVDNASGDGTADIVEARYPGVQLIRNSSRLGFSSNNNMVLRRGRGRYLMLLNDDTVVQDGALDALVAFMDAHPEAGAAGSALFNPDGTPQRSFARFPSPWLEGVWPAISWSHFLIRDKSEPFEVDSVCGAALLVRREIVDGVGFLDTAFDPIYSEEVDWCYRIRRAGWKIYLAPESRIVHYGSTTMNRAVPRKYELLLSHKALYFRKHMGPTAAGLYRAGLAGTSLLKCGWWAVACLLPGNRSERKARVRLHWHILRQLPTFA